MMRLLLDIAPYPDDWTRPYRVIHDVHNEVADTVDTLGTISQQVVDSAPTGGHVSFWLILGAIAAVLTGLGFLILMTRRLAAQRAAS